MAEKDSLRVRVRVAAAQMEGPETLWQFPGCLLRRQDFMPLNLLVARLEQRPVDTFAHCFGFNSVSWLVRRCAVASGATPKPYLENQGTFHVKGQAVRLGVESFAGKGLLGVGDKQM